MKTNDFELQKEMIILLKKQLTIMIIAVIYVFSLVPTVFADYLGGKWASNIGYYSNSSDPYYSADVTGPARWNNVCIKRKWTATTSTSAAVNSTSAFYGATGWNAQGQPGPSITSGTYTYGTVRYNRTYMDAYSSDKKKAISTHEHGHVMGLAHNIDTSTSLRSLMYKGGSSVYFDQWGIGSPTSRDITDINNLYK